MKNIIDLIKQGADSVIVSDICPPSLGVPIVLLEPILEVLILVGGVFKVANTARKAYKYRRAGKIARETGETSIPLRVGLQYNDDVLIAGVEIMARNETIRLGLHGGALIAGELAKIEGRQPGQPTTVEFGGREIFILDPYASLTTVTQPSSGQSSKLPRGATPKYLNRTSAKSKTKKSSRRSTMAPCRCKDGSYSINCC